MTAWTWRPLLWVADLKEDRRLGPEFLTKNQFVALLLGKKDWRQA